MTARIPAADEEDVLQRRGFFIVRLDHIICGSFSMCSSLWEIIEVARGSPSQSPGVTQADVVGSTCRTPQQLHRCTQQVFLTDTSIMGETHDAENLTTEGVVRLSLYQPYHRFVGGGGGG